MDHIRTVIADEEHHRAFRSADIFVAHKGITAHLGQGEFGCSKPQWYYICIGSRHATKVQHRMKRRFNVRQSLYARLLTGLFALLSFCAAAQDADTLEWATFGSSAYFQWRFQRSVNDTTLLHGSFMIDYRGNPLVRGNMEQNRKSGTWEHFDPNTGKLTAKGYYYAGERKGTWRFYFMEGHLRAEKEYLDQEDFKGVGNRRSFYDNQKLRSEIIGRGEVDINSLSYFNYLGDTTWTRVRDPKNPNRYYHQSYYDKGGPFERYSLLLLPEVELVQKFLREGRCYASEVLACNPLAVDGISRRLMTLDGNYRRYHDSGRLKEQRVYERGKLINVFQSSNSYGTPVDRGSFYEGTGSLILYGRVMDTARVEHYRDGLLDGPVRYLEDGNRERMRGQFKQGQPNGQWQLRGADLKVVETHDYLSGDSVLNKRTWRKRFQGHEGYNVGLLREGRWIEFDFYGDTANVIHYRNGLPHGPYREFRRGSFFKSGQFKHGVRDGLWQTYNARGKVTWADTLDARVFSHDFGPNNQLSDDYPVSAAPHFNPQWRAASLPPFLIQPPLELIRGRRYDVQISQGGFTGDVIFAIDVEDSGHIVGIECLKFSHVAYYDSALRILQTIPFAYPASFEGLPVNSRLIVAFSFIER